MRSRRINRISIFPVSGRLPHQVHLFFPAITCFILRLRLAGSQLLQVHQHSPHAPVAVLKLLGQQSLDAGSAPVLGERHLRSARTTTAAEPECPVPGGQGLPQRRPPGCRPGHRFDALEELGQKRRVPSRNLFRAGRVGTPGRFPLGSSTPGAGEQSVRGGHAEHQGREDEARASVAGLS